METQHVDPATIGVWRWHGAITTLVVTAFAALLILPQSQWWWPAAAGLACSGMALSWFLPPLYFEHLVYGLDEGGIVIQRGLWWRSHIALRRVRIQHTDVSQGPLQRRFGVGTLKLYTAGSRFTRIELAGLRHADALALRDALLAGNAASGV